MTIGYSDIKELLKNKYVKIFLRVAGTLLVLIILALTTAGLYVHLNKEKIIAKAKELVANAIKGEAEIKDIDISVWSSFPHVAVKLSHVSLLDSHYHKPLLQAGEIAVSIGLFQLLHPREIARLKISDCSFHLFTDTSGYSNSYLLSKKDTALSASSSSSLIINHVELENVNILIEHAVRQKRYEFNFSSLQADINRKDSSLHIKMNEKCLMNGLAFNLLKGSYLQNHLIEADGWRLRFNTVSKELLFDETAININNQKYLLRGKFHFRDSAFFQLHVKTTGVPLKQAAKILTDRIQKKINVVDLKNKINVEATLEGPLEGGGDPYVTAAIQTSGNEIGTPVTNFTNCSFEGKFINHMSDSLPPSDENSIILFTKFSGGWNGINIIADSILISNLAKPVLQFSFLSQCSLKELDANLALTTIKFMDGNANLVLQYNGPLIANTDLLTKLRAKFLLKNGSLLYVPRNIQITNCNGDIGLSEDELVINNLQCDINKNHFEITAGGYNLSHLAGADAGKANVSVNIKTPSINLNDFSFLFGNKKAVAARNNKKNELASTVSVVDNLLEKGTLQLNISAGHAEYDRFIADNVTAAVLFATDNWQIQHASLRHAGGKFTMDAKIREVRDNYHRATASINLENADVRKVFYAFNDFGQDGISYSNIRGTMNTKADIILGIGSGSHIIPKSVQGTVDFSILKGALVNFKPLENINSLVFKNRDFSNIEFAELKDRLIIGNNEVQINRMEITSSVLHMYAEGVYDLAKTNTDISIQIPLSNLKKQDENLKPKNKGVDAKTGASIYLRAKGNSNGEVKIGIDVFKKLRRNKKDKTENDN